VAAVSFLAGLPQFLALGGVLYLVAESGSRWLALGVSGVLFVWLLVELRREARRR